MRNFKLLLLFSFFFCQLSGQVRPHSMGVIPDENAYNSTPSQYLGKTSWKIRKTVKKEELPASYSLEKYCPHPKSQGDYGTCVAWAICAVREIHYNEANEQLGEGMENFRFSQGFIYQNIKGIDDFDCQKGSKIAKGLETIKTKGVCLEQTLSEDCEVLIDYDVLSEAAQYKILDYRKINALQSKAGVDEIKLLLFNGHPSVIAFRVPYSFHNNSGDYWQPDQGEIPSRGGRHAMVVVGYDDEYKVPGKRKGAFRIMNSWGDDWKDGGFCWVAYTDFKNYCYEAYYMIPVDAEAPNIYNGKLHLIAVGETTTEASHLVKANIDYFYNSFFQLAQSALLEPIPQTFIGNNCNRFSLQQGLETLSESVGKDDVVVLYYIGSSYNNGQSPYPYLKFSSGQGMTSDELERKISGLGARANIIITDGDNAEDDDSFRKRSRRLSALFTPNVSALDNVVYNHSLTTQLERFNGTLLYASTSPKQKLVFDLKSNVSIALQNLITQLSDLSDQNFETVLNVAAYATENQVLANFSRSQKPMFRIQNFGDLPEGHKDYYSCSIQDALALDIALLGTDSFEYRMNIAERIKGKYEENAEVVVLIEGIPVERLPADRYFKELAVNHNIDSISLERIANPNDCFPSLLYINEYYSLEKSTDTMIRDDTTALKKRLEQRTDFLWGNIKRLAKDTTLSDKEKEVILDVTLLLFKAPNTDTVEVTTLFPKMDSLIIHRYETAESYLKDRVDDFYKNRYRDLFITHLIKSSALSTDKATGKTTVYQYFLAEGDNSSSDYDDISEKEISFSLEDLDGTAKTNGLRIKITKIKVNSTKPFAAP